jgi:AcrR family transcriptional regulator
MPRTVKKPEERRAEIIKAARKLFQANEYDKVTMQELMDTLNIAKGTIYHYFSSKAELLEAVVEDLVDEDLRRKEALMNDSKNRNLNALDKLRILITDDTLAEDHAHLLDSLHQSDDSKMHVRQLGHHLTRLAPLYAAIIEEGCAQGIFATRHPLECSEFLLAGTQFLTDVGLYPWSDEQLARRMAALPDLIEDQLHAPPGSFSFLAEQ